MELDLMEDQTGKTNNLTGKYIMELSKLKYLQIYTTPFKLNYIWFEHQPQIQQLSLTFTPTTEEISETLEKSDIDMNTSHSIIEPVVNRNFGKTFQHHNGPNQIQHTHKNTSQQHHHINTSQQHKHRNTSQQYLHINTSQQYQPRYCQRPRTSPIPHLKYDCIGCGFNNKGVRELLKHNYETLEDFPFRGPLYIHKNAPREQHIQKNHKNWSRPNNFNKNKDTSNNTDPHQDTISCPRPKLNSVHFEDPYEHINPMENTHEDTHLIDTQEKDIEDNEVEQE